MAKQGYLSHDLGGMNPTDRALAAGYTCRAYHGDGSYSIGLSENIAEQTIAKGWTRRGSGSWKVTGYWSSEEAAAELVKGWLGSIGHKENILDKDAKRIGVGVQLGRKQKEGILTDVLFATQNFSACSSASAQAVSSPTSTPPVSSPTPTQLPSTAVPLPKVFPTPTQTRPITTPTPIPRPQPTATSTPRPTPPTPKPALPTPTPEPTTKLSTLQTSHVGGWIVYFANLERSKHGLKELIVDGAISEIALAHSSNMRLQGTVTHIIHGLSPTDRAIEVGYDCKAYNSDGTYSHGLAENIAKTPRVRYYESRGGVYVAVEYSKDAEAMGHYIVQEWMGSPDHRANILHEDYTRIGVGVAVDQQSRNGFIHEEFFSTLNFSACE